MAFSWNRSSTNAALNPQDNAPPASAGSGAAPDGQAKKIEELIVGFYNYLDENAPSHLALAPAITQLRAAVAIYRSGQAGDPADAIRRVLASIQSARQVDPSIPQP